MPSDDVDTPDTDALRLAADLEMVARALRKESEWGKHSTQGELLRHLLDCLSATSPLQSAHRRVASQGRLYLGSELAGETVRAVYLTETAREPAQEHTEEPAK